VYELETCRGENDENDGEPANEAKQDEAETTTTVTDALLLFLVDASPVRFSTSQW